MLALCLLAGNVLADPAERFQHARSLTRGGEHAAALVEISKLRAEYPHDVDYALARAQVLMRLDRNDEALDELRTAAVLAPDYETVWQLRYGLLSRSDDATAEGELARIRSTAARRFPDSDWWRMPGAIEDSGSWVVTVGAGHDELSGSLPSWGRQFVDSRFERPDGSAYFAGIARDARFDDADTSFRLGAEWAFAEAWRAGLEIGGVDDPAFQPDFGYALHVSRSFDDGWGANVRLQGRDYPTTTSTSLNSSVEKYVGDYRIAYALGLGRLSGASPVASHAVTDDWYISDRSSIGISINAGEEVEAIGAGRVLETDVRGIGLRGRRQLNRRFGLRWWLGWHEQGEFYERTYLGLAVSYRI